MIDPEYLIKKEVEENSTEECNYSQLFDDFATIPSAGPTNKEYSSEEPYANFSLVGIQVKTEPLYHSKESITDCDTQGHDDLSYILPEFQSIDFEDVLPKIPSALANKNENISKELYENFSSEGIHVKTEHPCHSGESLTDCDSQEQDELTHILPESQSIEIEEENSLESLFSPHEIFSSVVSQIETECLSDSSDLKQECLPTNDETKIRKAQEQQLIIFKCEQCFYVTNSKSNLRRHKLIHSPDKPFKCDQCSYASHLKDKLQSHKLIHSPDKYYKCDQCSYSTHLKRSFNTHKLNHSTDKPFKCDQCTYASNGKHKLNSHMLIHLPDKPFKCDQCSYASFRKQDLIKHKRNHLVYKSFKCDQCPYASYQKQGLIKHKLTHLSVKPFQCDQCRYAGSSRVKLKKHVLIHSSDKPFKCDQCPYASHLKKCLKRHNLTHLTDETRG